MGGFIHEPLLWFNSEFLPKANGKNMTTEAGIGVFSKNPRKNWLKDVFI